METSMRTVLFALAALLQAPAGCAVAPLPPPPPPPPPGALTPPRGPLLVQEPPPRVVFSNATGALLPCAATGNPPPTLRWQSASGAELSPVSVAGLRAALPGGWLQLPPFPGRLFRPEVHAAAYRCVASNVVGTVVSRAVTVRAVVLDQRYEAQVHDEFVIAGNTAVLRCHVPAFARDFVSVSGWLRGEPPRALTPDVTTGGRFSVFPTGELHIRAATEEDARAGPYRCRTAHALSGHTAVSSTAGRLVVTEARGSVAPRLTDTRSHVTARARQAAELPCAAQAYPLPTYTWYRGGGGGDGPAAAVPLGERVQQVGGNLFFRRVTLADAGRYSCLVNNTAGHLRAPTTLTVTAPLSCHLSPQLQTVSAGQTATFNCTTEGHPQKTLVWLKDGQPLLPSTRIHIGAGNKTLKIHHSERSDAGMYQCIVSNDEESAQGTAQLNLGASAPVLLRTFVAATVRPGAAWRAACEAAGSPRPAVSWRLDGAPLPPQHRVAESSAAGAQLSELVVARAGPDDAGVYRCEAANAAGAVAHEAALRVLGPPHVKTMEDRRVRAGRDAVFSCRVAGFPISQIQWQRNGKFLPQNHRQLVFPNGTLIIRDAKKEDEGGYLCVASNPDGLTSRSKLMVQVMEAPVIDRLYTKKDVQKGMRVHLHCVVVKGDFPISLQWLKDGQTIPYRLSVAERTIDEYSSTLTINKVTEEHRGNYTCIAGNAVANTSHTTQLIVNVPPTWLHEPEDINVLMGDTLLIPCAADGSPKPVILWRKESDSPESPSQNHVFKTTNYKVLNNGSLWIENVLPEDKGYYSCEAKNEIGMALNKIIYVTVHVPARFSTSLQNVTVAKGGTAAIDCVARGDKPITVKWFHSGNLFEAHNHPRADVSEESLEFGIHSRITLKNVLRNDTSAFTCHANNQYGSDQSEIWVIVQEVPEPPGNLRVRNFSSRAVNLTWEQPYNGNSQITVYTVQHKHKLVAWEKNVSQMTVPGDQTFASITGLQPANSYHFRVTARNALGSSNASDTVTVTTAEEAPGEAPQEIRVRAVSSESLHVSWKPPRDQYQHGEIIGYYIGYRTSNSSEPFHYKTYEVLPGAELRILLTGLQKFTEYVIFVQAYNSAGAGPQSLGITVFTEEDVPEVPPGNLQCTSTSSQSILLTWLPIAADDVNGILLGYKVLYNTVSEWDEVSAPTESSTEECRLELMALQKYCNYSIEVKGYTRMGDGIPSRPVFCRTQEDVPDKPDDIKALVVNAETLLISWLKPKYPNGIIRKYVVYVRSLDGGTLLREEYEIPPTQTHYILSHLIPHHRYELWVTAATVVGESDASLHVVQAPTEQVPARIASFGMHVMAARGEQLSLPCIIVGQPHPTTIWSKGGVPVQGSNDIHINSEWTLHFSSIEASDTGNYSCRVQNILGADEITYTVTVKNRRNDGSPLPPVDFRVSSTTETSLSLKWAAPEDSIYTAEGYTLYFKREFGEWEKVIIQAEDKNFTLVNLQCGSKYQLYLQAFNHMGNSSPTKNITAYTQGKAPIAPKKDDLLAANSTFIQLNVGTWNTGGCPITTLVVEYKLKTGTKWILVSNNLKYSEEKFSILDLNPVTHYELRMTAHNSAGSTVVTYDFTTLSSTGAVVHPELIMWGNYRRKYFYKDPGVIIPVAVITLIGITFGIGMFLYVKRKKRNHADSKTEGDNITDPHVQSEDKVGYSTADVSQDQKSNQTSSASDTTARVNPYATFRLTDEEKLKAIIHDYESCSEYWKINKNPDSEGEGVDWIPLHSLYQAHRY